MNKAILYLRTNRFNSEGLCNDGHYFGSLERDSGGAVIGASWQSPNYRLRYDFAKILDS